MSWILFKCLCYMLTLWSLTWTKNYIADIFELRSFIYLWWAMQWRSWKTCICKFSPSFITGKLSSKFPLFSFFGTSTSGTLTILFQGLDQLSPTHEVSDPSLLHIIWCRMPLLSYHFLPLFSLVCTIEDEQKIPFSLYCKTLYSYNCDVCYTFECSATFAS